MTNASALGITFPGGFGGLASGSLGQCASHNMVELFWNDTAMVLARYPNIASNGTWQWMTISSVNGNSDTTEFQLNEPRVLNWAKESDAWFHGFWAFDWADSYVQPASIVAQGSAGVTVTVSAATPPVYTFNKNARVMGVNILAELDAPGEYYLDRTEGSGLLHFCPPGGDVSAAEAVLSIANNVVVLSTSTDDSGSSVPVSIHAPLALMDRSPILPVDTPRHAVPVYRRHGYGGAVEEAVVVAELEESPAPPRSPSSLQFVTLNGFNIEFSRGVGLSASQVTGVVLSNLEVSNHGQNAIALDGTDNTISGVGVAGTGCAAVGLSGGNTATLTPGNNLVTGSTVHDYARITRTYNPGVSFSGVGNTVERSLIYNAPHQALFGSGNNHLFSNNVVHDVCFEATDSGAWYMGRSWITRGTVIVGNTFTRVRTTEIVYLGYPIVNGVYLDDQLSGITVINNTFVDCTQGVLVGGGRDVVVNFNSFQGCGTGIGFDNRGMNWQLGMCTYNSTYTGELVQGLFNVKYTQPPYATEYPPIVSTLQDHPCVPVNVTIQDNTYCGITGKFLTATPQEMQSWFDPAPTGNTQC